VFGEQTIESFVFECYQDLAVKAKITTWLDVATERFATQRLEALAHAQSQVEDKVPAVLFLCVHNAGRSQMGAALREGRQAAIGTVSFA
jgi:hypothetical protein